MDLATGMFIMAVVKTRLPADEPIFIPCEETVEIVFQQISAFYGDPLEIESKLPKSRIELNATGLVSLDGYIRFKNTINENYTVDMELIAYSEEDFYAPKVLGKSRWVTNGSGDGHVEAMPFVLREGTKVWARVWQSNPDCKTLETEYVYMCIRIDDTNIVPYTNKR